MKNSKVSLDKVTYLVGLGTKIQIWLCIEVLDVTANIKH